jgi:hypothetical protein
MRSSATASARARLRTAWTTLRVAVARPFFESVESKCRTWARRILPISMLPIVAGLMWFLMIERYCVTESGASSPSRSVSHDVRNSPSGVLSSTMTSPRSWRPRSSLRWLSASPFVLNSLTHFCFRLSSASRPTSSTTAQRPLARFVM